MYTRFQVTTKATIFYLLGYMSLRGKKHRENEKKFNVPNCALLFHFFFLMKCAILAQTYVMVKRLANTCVHVYFWVLHIKSIDV